MSYIYINEGVVLWMMDEGLDASYQVPVPGIPGTGTFNVLSWPGSVLVAYSSLVLQNFKNRATPRHTRHAVQGGARAFDNLYCTLTLKPEPGREEPFPVQPNYNCASAPSFHPHPI
jgi:hypothetical protein